MSYRRPVFGQCRVRRWLSAQACAPQQDLPDPVWEVTAHYLAALCANIVLLASPEVHHVSC